jgi:YidC/Oxa1 family membrane protein insertase
MDRKAIIILVVCFALLLGWSPLVNHFFPPPPLPTNTVASATSPMSAATLSAPGTNQAPAAASVSSVTAPAVSPAGSNAPARYIVHSEIPEQLVTITNGEARYVFTSRGGGLKLVELSRYPATISRLRKKKPAETNDFATLNAPDGPPVFTIMGQGTETLQGDGVFTLTPTNGGVRAEKVLANGLAVIKDLRVGTNYLLTASVRFENRSSQPLALPTQDWVVGAATPMDAQDHGMSMSVLWYDGTKTYPVALTYFNTNTTWMFIGHRTPLTEFHAGNTNVAWVSAQNQFFALATMMTNPAPALTVRMVDLPAPPMEELANPRTVRTPKGLQAVLNYPALVLAPGQGSGQYFNLFAGPKEYRTLARIGARFDNNVEWVMGFNGFFGWFAKALLSGMNLLHARAGLPFGWAIVVITVLIKLVFWPLTQYSTKSMKRMQALQPQMKALQEKYKDDPQKLSQKQMEFWRKNKVNPLSGCLPMLLQLPLLWGFYRMLLNAIELRGASFLWIGDLSKPDTIFNLPIPFPLFGMDSLPVNPMPLLMGATMLWQSHLTPPSPGMDPAQQKIMRYMPLIFLVFMYNFSSGLALYWTVQNLLSILQTKLIPASALAPTAAAPTPAPQKKRNN